MPQYTTKQATENPVVSDQSANNPFSLFGQFWESLKIVAQPYWYPTELNGRAFGDVIISWGMSALILLSILATVGVEAFSSYWNRYVLDIIIEDRDLSKYLNTLWLSSLLIIYWRVASLLLITVYLMIASWPIGFVTSFLAKILIPISLWFWVDINDEIKDLPSSPIKFVTTAWRWAVTIYCPLDNQPAEFARTTNKPPEKRGQETSSVWS